MKKIYILLFTVLAFVVGRAQNFQTLPSEVATEFRANDEAPQESLRGGDEDPFWYSDFSDATLWDAETVLGNYNWVIGDTENGWFYGGDINSSSGGEYAFVWNGAANDDTEILVQGQSILTTAESIDVSGIESAILTFEMYGARFTDSLKVEVSNDGLVWELIGNQQDVGQLTAGGGSVTSNPITRTYNMTLAVAGEDNLWIRFNYETATSGVAYGWFIDDVTILIPEAYDLAIADVYTGDIVNDFEYTITPIEQVHTINLGAEITNLGGLEAMSSRLSVEVFLEGTVDAVYTGESDPVSIAQGETALLWIFSDFTPTDIGDYNVVFTALQDDVDGIPGDNENEKEFRIDEIFWANDDYNNLDADWDGELGTVTVNDEWIIATTFTCFEPGTRFEAASISLGTGTVTSSDSPTEAAIVLFLNSNPPQFITSTEFEIVNSDIFGSGFMSIEMDDQIELTPGESYVVGVQHLQGEGRLVLDASEYDNDFSTLIFGGYGTGGAQDWFVFDDISPAIRISTSDIISVPEINERNLTIGQNYPNPVFGKTTIPYSLVSAQKITFEITDMTGRLMYTQYLGTVSAGSKKLEISDLELTSGLYNYSFLGENFKVTKTLSSN
tara:strand:- start:7890 stop:9731 length:1842 start_codon:yes stop_codon:yes gene_type:complete